jgi:hypothetical protein
MFAPKGTAASDRRQAAILGDRNLASAAAAAANRSAAKSRQNARADRPASEHVLRIDASLRPLTNAGAMIISHKFA